MNTIIVLKVTIVSSKNGSNTSRTKHLNLGSKIEISKDEHIESITLDDVKIIYNLSEILEDKEE
jgi:hypothetical protein